MLAGLNGTVAANGTVWTNTGGVTVTATAKFNAAPGALSIRSRVFRACRGATTQIGCSLSPNGVAN
jgi:hypothetical protein